MWCPKLSWCLFVAIISIGYPTAANTDNTTIEKKEPGPPNENGSSSIIILIFIIVICLSAIIIGVGFFLYRRRQDSSKRAHWLNKELANECKTEHVYTDSEMLSQTTDDLLKDEKTAEIFLFDKVGNKDADVEREINNETKEISTCNDTSIPCLTRTHVRTMQPSKLPKVLLNTNLLHDFYMAPIYVGQVPIKAEFEAFWQAVDEFNITIVVWLDSGAHDVEEYHVPIRQMFIPEKYGAYSARNVNVLSFLKEHKIYELEYVRGGKFDAEKSKRLYVFEIPNWPCTAADKIETDKLMRLLESVDNYHQKQQHKRPSKPKPNLASIMVHCKNGVTQSVTFTALYIGRQMWLSESEVNPIGIMRYIRNCRHGAFTKANSPGKLIQTVYSTLSAYIKNEGNTMKVRKNASSKSSKESKSVSLNASLKTLAINKTKRLP